MNDMRRHYGYPEEWGVPAHNRHDANQPGALAEPEQVDFDSRPRLYANALREDIAYDSPEPNMNYTQANQPDG